MKHPIVTTPKVKNMAAYPKVWPMTMNSTTLKAQENQFVTCDHLNYCLFPTSGMYIGIAGSSVAPFNPMKIMIRVTTI